jgi:tRNA dimethylallyltransferase
MQIYRGFDAGTGKPPPALRARAAHHLIDVADPASDFSLGDYVRRSSGVVEELLAAGKLPIVAGGTGLYLRGLLRGIFEGPRRDIAMRARLLRSAERRGPTHLHRLLARVDGPTAKRLAPRDQQRIVRALEVAFATGRPLSAHLEMAGFAGDRWRAVKIGLVLPRPLLWEKIRERAARFLAEGWEDEVKRLLLEGPPETANAWKALGYREIVRLVRGEVSRDEALEAIVRETRQYAKRQMTWFRREPAVSWFEHQGAVPVDEIERVVRERL